MSDLFESTAPKQETYSAQDIQVLEGLEAVRARPGMYIGGTDAQALHHLVAEILDNSMDEAVAGYANRIEVKMNADYSVTITDNGRGIPVDPHPKYPDMSALEVILTMFTPAASSAAVLTRFPAVCTVSACRSSMLCLPLWWLKSPAIKSFIAKLMPRANRLLLWSWSAMRPTVAALRLLFCLIRRFSVPILS